jgi:hypothetical protein
MADRRHIEREAVLMCPSLPNNAPMCPTCGNPILDGETIRWTPDKRLVYHSGCYPKERSILAMYLEGVD